jgi:hypothetical protein
MIQIKENGAWIQDPDGGIHVHLENMSRILLDLANKYSPNLVYDFGCGLGSYTKDISDAGIEAIGFEPYPDYSVYDNIQKIDLSVPLSLPRKADMSISLEVGEHIPKEFEQIFIDNICNNTKDILVLSWAVEGQGGHGHVNCRNNDYIIAEVEKRGFRFDESILNIRNVTENLRWFRSTLMLFQRKTFA